MVFTMKIKSRPKEMEIRESPEYDKIIDNIFEIFNDSRLNHFEVLGILDTIKFCIQNDLIDSDCNCEDCSNDN